MKRLIFVLTIVAAGAMFAGCNCCSGCGKAKAKEITKGPQTLVGADRDEHGCIGSAGYVWSQVRQDCIRVFEQGTALKDRRIKNPTLAAYIVFSADSSKVELFLPGTGAQILDRRKLPSGGYVWNQQDDDTYNLRLVDGLWTVDRRATVQFSQERR